MYELKITVSKVLGECTASLPMMPGDYITVRNGDISIPEGGYICMWALQSLLPVITVKERQILEEKDQDWVWRRHHVQCPDPEGRVVYKIERVAEVVQEVEVGGETGGTEGFEGAEGSEEGLWNLRVVVEEVRGTCTSGLRPGDHFVLRSGRLFIPAHRHFCLHALHAALPFLPAKQRPLEDGDWLKEDNHVICPDPAGNVIMRIERIGEEAYS